MSKVVNQPRRGWTAVVGGAAILCGCGRTLAPAGSTPAVAPPPAAVPVPSYAGVIPPGAVTKNGLFKVHRAGEKLFFEIPRRELGQELLLARVGGGWPGRGVPPAVVVFQQAGNRLVLRQRSYGVRADSSTSIHQAVARRNQVIIATLDIQALGPDSAPVVDVTSFLTADFSSSSFTVDPQRSFIEGFTAFPDNVAVEVTVTGTLASAPPETGRVTWNFYKPARLMRPRRYDERVGLDGVCFVDFSPEQQARGRGFIRRFRLEKKNPEAAVSDPVRPIVFWIDRATPEWLIPWVQRGVEAWSPVFRDAGFSNAIMAKLAPGPDEAPEWSAGDVRYSMIRMVPDSAAVGASGGIMALDPRTGEILRADVALFNNMHLFTLYYVIQASPLDVRARTLPLPDTLSGRLVEYMVTHEVGHAIGLPHNMKASSQYPVDSLRSASFLRRMGVAPSVMDYERFNYVAQPEDSVPPELLIPRVGPYDRFAVTWAYREIPGARTPDDEWPTLDEWARRTESTPVLRYEVTDATADPGELTESVGDADAVQASTLGMKNLARTMAMLLKVSEKPGQDYGLLKDLYGHALLQWVRYNWHVAALIGGVEAEERFGTGARFAAVPAARQREAVRYLADQAFRVPAMFLDTVMLRRMEQEGVVDRIREVHGGLLNALLSGRRLNRLLEYEALAGPRADRYAAAQFLADLRRDVWSELAARAPRIDIYRRNLQHAYLEAARQTIEQPSEAVPAAPLHEYIRAGPSCVEHRSVAQKTADGPSRFGGDARALLRTELAEIRQEARRALGRTTDQMTRVHLRDVDIQVERILSGSQDQSRTVGE